MVLLSALLNFLLMELARQIYQKLLWDEGLVRDIDTLGVLFKVISSLTEPDTVNIFPKWSTGSALNFKRVIPLLSYILFLESRKSI